MSELKPVQGAVVPPRVDLKQAGSRIGHADRRRVARQVRASLKSGHLSGDEAGLRENLAEAAITRQQLDNLLADLPEDARGRDRWQRPAVFAPVLGVLLTTTVTVIVIPVIMCSAHHSYTEQSELAAVIIFGIISMIFTGFWLISKLVGYYTHREDGK